MQHATDSPVHVVLPTLPHRSASPCGAQLGPRVEEPPHAHDAPLHTPITVLKSGSE